MKGLKLIGLYTVATTTMTSLSNSIVSVQGKENFFYSTQCDQNEYYKKNFAKYLA